MTLPWVRLETSFPTNHKVLALAERGKFRAIAVYTFALSYCGANETDGFIRRAALPFIHGRPADARDLVEVGLWSDFAEGWIIPDWAQYQVTKDKSDDHRARGRRGACERWMRDGKACTCGTHV